MVGSSKRYGVRYGRRLRQKYEAVETEQKTKYQCPYCHKIAVKRIAVGIWQCPKCAAVFTGKAYSVAKQGSTQEAPVEEIMEEAPEAEEDYESEEEMQQEEQQTV